ncbi:MAG: aminotransferase class V-fold PLP-dependent enzyme [Melioribacteraceae bacterium]|nr:aminotransferase class V-fold PLP-dependent enzyme [Melioribacteraceae bacterium]MDD3559098.1 aminotransferase class V-fold PLP-dependent enzyme [Melioribacteraceae bacterium]
MNINEVRKNFDYLKSGKVYFNHAAIGPLSNNVVSRINKYIELRSTGEIENYPAFLSAQENVKRMLSKIFNASPERFAFVDSVSNGFNILAQGIEWKTGDRIILNDIEFPANVYPFLNLRKLGVEIDFVQSKKGRIEIDDIEALLTPRTRLLSISAVQFLTGFRSDLDAIGKLCKSHNVIFSVDVIQAAGAVNIDVKRSSIDFLCGGSHKWFMGLQGASYFYLTEELQSMLKQKFIGWLSVENSWDFTDYKLELMKSAGSFQNGSLNVIGYISFEESLKLFDSLGMDKIERQIISNTEYLIKRLDNIGLEPILKCVDQKHLSGIVSVNHSDSENLKNEIQKSGIIFSCRESKLRFSPHFYNTKDEIDMLTSELKRYVK